MSSKQTSKNAKTALASGDKDEDTDMVFNSNTNVSNNDKKIKFDNGDENSNDNTSDTNNDSNNDNENDNNASGNNNDNDNNHGSDEKSSIVDNNIDITKIDQDLRPLRIYLDGVFDVTHYGHYRLFKAVKDKFPNSTIIVGVSGDEETIRLKGQTLMNESERAESVGHCKWVDEVVCPCPWIITQEFIDKQKLDYVAHDGLPYVSAGESDIYDFVKKQGKFIATQRTDGISTTDLINRIVKRYNEFVLRNLERGVSREDLNLSWTRQKRIEMGAAAHSSISKIKEMPNTVKQKSGELVENVFTWIQNPNAFVESFTNTFGRQGKIATKVKQNVQKYKEDFVEYAQYAPM